MSKCEICGHEEDGAVICWRCGFYMHTHGHDYCYHGSKGVIYTSRTRYPFINKVITNKIFYPDIANARRKTYMHMRVQNHG